MESRVLTEHAQRAAHEACDPVGMATRPASVDQIAEDRDVLDATAQRGRPDDLVPPRSPEIGNRSRLSTYHNADSGF